MRLNYKYTFGYSIITFFTLVVGFSIIYNTLKRATTQTAIGKLKNLNTIIAGKIADGNNFTAASEAKNVTIIALDQRVEANPEKVTTTRMWNPELLDTITNISLTTHHKIKNRQFAITSKTFIITPDTIYLNGIFMVFAWTFIFLISVVIISSEVISGYILSPFYAALQAVKNFSIDQKESIAFEKTTTYEFKELQGFLQRMTENATKDYNILKEMKAFL